MAESRKACYTILLDKRGNGKPKLKIEVFASSQWSRQLSVRFNHSEYMRSHYRVRCNGKWFPYDQDGITLFTMTQIKELTFRAMAKM